KLLYNPKSRVIDYVVPGIIGLILQLLTVTLMACTIARERESGTLYQLMITALRRREIVIGKMLPYLLVSSVLIIIIMLLSGWHFGVAFHDLPALALVCVLFLLCSLGLGLLISAFSRTQTQAISFRFSFCSRSSCFQEHSHLSNNCPRQFATFPSFFRLHIFAAPFGW